jgi:hypothetical protein
MVITAHEEEVGMSVDGLVVAPSSEAATAATPTGAD